ncbi:MAG: hypothetical protein Kow0080_10460 [Candidatus Promineifilaceae bacterium]
MSDNWIRASEIGDYIYCRRSWYLRRKRQVPSANVRQLRQGTAHHQKHGRRVVLSVWMRRLAYAFIFLVVATAVYQLVGGF